MAKKVAKFCFEAEKMRKLSGIVGFACFCDFRLIFGTFKIELATFLAKIEKGASTVFNIFIIPDC